MNSHRILFCPNLPFNSPLEAQKNYKQILSEKLAIKVTF